MRRFAASAKVFFMTLFLTAFALQLANSYVDLPLSLGLLVILLLFFEIASCLHRDLDLGHLWPFILWRPEIAMHRHGEQRKFSRLVSLVLTNKRAVLQWRSPAFARGAGALAAEPE